MMAIGSPGRIKLAGRLVRLALVGLGSVCVFRLLMPASALPFGVADSSSLGD